MHRTNTADIEEQFGNLRRAYGAPAALAHLRFLGLTTPEWSGGLVELPVAIYEGPELGGHNHPISWDRDPGGVFPTGATEVDWKAGSRHGTVVVVVDPCVPTVGRIATGALMGRQELHTAAWGGVKLRRALEARKRDEGRSLARISELSENVVRSALVRAERRCSVLAAWSLEDARQEAQIAICRLARRFATADRPATSWWPAVSAEIHKAIHRSADRIGGHSSEAGAVAAVVDSLWSQFQREPSTAEIEAQLSGHYSQAIVEFARAKPWVNTPLDNALHDVGYETDPLDGEQFGEEDWTATPGQRVSGWGQVLEAAYRRGWIEGAPTDTQAAVVISAAGRGHSAVAVVLGRLLDQGRRLLSRPPAAYEASLAQWAENQDRSWLGLAKILSETGLDLSYARVAEMVNGDKASLVAALDQIGDVKPPPTQKRRTTASR